MTTVIVIGMHRSGTSMISGILYHLGVFMGEDLMIEPIPQQPQQPRGYYEDRQIISLNERLLTACGGGWDYPPPSISLPPEHELIKEMERLIKSREERGGGTEIWGWKDPRTVLTLPLYLPRLKSDVKIIYIKRNRDQVIESLHKREEKRTREWCEEIYDIYAEHIRANLRGLDVLRLDYNATMCGLNITPVVKIISFLKIMPDYNQIKAAINHIQPRREVVEA